jgi:hypothetical protein
MGLKWRQISKINGHHEDGVKRYGSCHLLIEWPGLKSRARAEKRMLKETDEI